MPGHVVRSHAYFNISRAPKNYINTAADYLNSIVIWHIIICMLSQEELKSLVSYNPETGIFIRLLNGKQLGSLDKFGYMQTNIKKKHYRLHRLVWLYVYGYLPKVIDHVNGKRHDNRLSNLRECTAAENTRNQMISKNNNSGVKGISFSKHANSWRATLTFDGKQIHVGYYKDKNKAIAAIKSARAKYHGEFARDF